MEPRHYSSPTTLEWQMHRRTLSPLLGCHLSLSCGPMECSLYCATLTPQRCSTTTLRGLTPERGPVRPEPREEECSTEIVATITGGYAKGITWSVWKAQLRGVQQALMAEQGNYVIVPTIVFEAREGPYFTPPHNDLLVVEIKGQCHHPMNPD
ncbi:hypothetical protein Cgig2_031920 [Carnegiea gigantea]|uniref:Uncharacterized protein n=1 Tax=Carnegiea gigantea TaxID=171969 RepID=A0A9Q1GLT9_9CARY|nr:hypothetical protein Cgig2_031920 [Carnegiea gigantea]